METLSSSRHLISTIKYSDVFPNRFPVIPFHLRRFGVQVRPRRFLASSNKSSFQDFQEYAKPRQLFPTTDPTKFTDEAPEKIVSYFQSDGLQFLYKVLLYTSSIYGSGLSDLNAGILLCIIDEDGDSILKRIPAILHQGRIQQSEDDVASDVIFQRGSTDEFMFWGPKLGRIQAMWISLDSGTWRLGGARLTMICAYNHHAEESSANGSLYCCITYNFEVEDALLGEGSDMAMAELRPCSVMEYSGADYVSFVYRNVAEAASLVENEITNEDSMREYADLKHSLLLYDSMLIFVGTFVSSIIGGEKTALAFLTGGIGGFLYLLLLQRSVDGLPAAEAIVRNKESNFNRLLGGAKGPLMVLVFALGVAVLAVKHGTMDVEAALTPRELLVGMTGFLACKVSVVLAALKPMSMSMEENN